MATTNQWTNKDGLTIRFGEAVASPEYPVLASTVKFGHRGEVVVDFRHDNLPSYTTDRDNNGVRESYNNHDARIPAGAYITRAVLIATEAFAGTGEDQTVNVGLSKQDGTAISANGIFAALDFSALAAGSVSKGAGALVEGAVTIGDDDGYVNMVVAQGTITGGAGRLLIEYILPA